MANMMPGSIYDEEFANYLNIAKALVMQLPRKHDREIATKWIAKLCQMRSTDAHVKNNRNQFFKYMLTVLHRGVHDHPTAHYGYPQYANEVGVGEQQTGKDYMSRWSADKRTYVAVKPLPGRGALVYMAVSKQPELGWEYHK